MSYIDHRLGIFTSIKLYKFLSSKTEECGKIQPSYIILICLYKLHTPSPKRFYGLLWKYFCDTSTRFGCHPMSLAVSIYSTNPTSSSHPTRKNTSFDYTNWHFRFTWNFIFFHLQLKTMHFLGSFRTTRLGKIWLNILCIQKHDHFYTLQT